ncbi:anaphase-promoting complex subunit 1-like [Pocillopora damicornis]|uniref:anaphase-promoting complex subunit 1-like n=1 Tax=Pocillopora damicornis TaxID=46731 RepID=UPI000F555037|nr:anaphase-promoting complex subunit 1-like [Pocillopora damicornis]
MMISSVKVEKFEPFGKAFCSRHPFAALPKTSNKRSILESEIEPTCKWVLRSTKDHPECYEELFMQGNTVVWSVGKSQTVRTVQKCYSAMSLIVDCLWCTFSLPSEYCNRGENQVSSGETLHSLCVLQNDCIDVLTEDGALFTITLPFPVKQVVALQEGLLLERATAPGEITGQRRDVPTMFSVLHPLDEPRPITSKVEGKIFYICDPAVSVVFSCSDPPLVMTYDFVIGLHSVWHVTKATAQKKVKQPLMVKDSPVRVGLRSPVPFFSPPMSCFSSKEESSWDSFQPLSPDVCLTQVWQETQVAVRYGTKGKASKAFLTKDKSGATFLCYLLGQLEKLRGVQVIQERDCVDLNNTFEIPAKDAVPVEKLNVMLVLEPNYSLVIYSGMIKGCQVNLPIFSLLEVDQSLHFNTPEKVLSFSSIKLSNNEVNMDDVEGKPSLGNALQDVKILSLRDPVSETCNLVLSDGSIYRIKLPILSQNLAVTACLEALKYILPGLLVIQAQLACYAVAQVPHLQDSEQEWKWFTKCVLELMGFQTEDKFKSDSPELPAAKKSKTQEEDQAWEMLTMSDFHQNMSRQGIGLPPLLNKETPGEEKHSFPMQIKKDALLHNHISSILFAWHLIYEDLKLNILGKDSLCPMAQFLCDLALALGWHAYVDYYCRDFPSLFLGSRDSPAHIIRDQQSEMFLPLCEKPPSIIQWLYNFLNGHPVEPFPVLPRTTKHTYNIIMLYSLFNNIEDKNNLEDDADKLFKCISYSEEVIATFKESFVTTQEKLRCFDSDADKVVAFLASSGREDLASMLMTDAKKLNTYIPLKKATLKDGEIDDGFNIDDEILRLRFGKDLRVQEMKRVLQSSKPVTVNVLQKPDVSDHDFIQEQENRLLLMCKRTMALPVGRGMFTMATSRPVLTETIPIPPLDLTGRAPPRNTTVGLEHVETPADMKMWPLFHNGVATGLRIAQGISQIDSTWIVYNKPKTNQQSEEHAGFLMALGLNGHLKNLSHMNLHDYLCKGHELTTVALLLGTAAAKRGTMDVTITKMLSIHIDALLPPTSAELDLHHSAQVAAILGVGLLYQGTAQRRMAEVLLSEIGRPPGPEMENAVNRESYSLAAGLALGLVMLEHGNEAASVVDLKIADQLYHYMVGGQTKPQTGTQKEKFKSPSYQIKEGDSVNINVTGPGATLALGLMFMKTKNTSVAAWFDAPDTQVLLDFIRPDFLLLRLLSRGLIMWDSIHPSTNWVESHIPAIVHQCDTTLAENEAANSDIDMESLSQAKINIIAGCCMAMGLRFAGSANQEAFNCLMHYTKYCKDLLSNSAVEQAGKPTVETCLNTILLSLAMVMAGTGNLDVLRIARQLRKRHSPDVPYGSHMAVHMAIGLLFLGAGRFTLSTDGPSIAALICAFYPRFPISSTDNRYHLQAFRHLYVLAAEPRVLVPREVDTNKACHVPLEVTLKETQFYPETVLKLTAPCILPELQLIRKICVSGLRYWPITIDLTESNDSFSLLTASQGTLFVKRRTGFLSYADDPQGYRNILAKTFSAQTDQIEVVRSFSSDPNLIALVELFGDKDPSNERERRLCSFIASTLVETVTEEKPEVLQILLRMWQIVHNLEYEPDPGSVWQMKLAVTFYKKVFSRISTRMRRKVCLVKQGCELSTRSNLHLSHCHRRLSTVNQETTFALVGILEV